MPYTPPSQRSPATSKSNSPKLTRSQSYDNAGLLSPNHAGKKPGVNRNLSSTAYIQKHRRSPSISQPNGSASDQTSNNRLQGSVSPIHTSNGVADIPEDYFIESQEADRFRWAELQHAVQSISQKRESSPSDSTEQIGRENAESGRTASLAKPALTAEARKISHSRSSSEITLSQLQTLNDFPLQTQSVDESEEDDDILQMKPPLVRKKSGELVKPALRPTARRRPSSMPGTPTYSKAVHFREDMEQVKHFNYVDRPIAVSANASPVENYDSESDFPWGVRNGRRSEWELRLVNFPRNTFERRSSRVWVERIFMSGDNRTMIGTVAVANIAFHKAVVARFTLDYWKTVSEVTAEYNDDARAQDQQDGYDRFNFTVALTDQAHLETRTLQLCVRYCVNGATYWDNNNHMNFKVDFLKKNTKNQSNGTGPKPTIDANSLEASSQQSRRSNTVSSAPRPLSMPLSFDEDFEMAINRRFDADPKKFSLAEPTAVRLKKKPLTGGPGDSLRTGESAGSVNQAFSTRYDFGVSLSSAVSKVKSELGDRSSIQPKQSPAKVLDTAQEEKITSAGNGSPVRPTNDNATPHLSEMTMEPGVASANRRPDTLTSEKPDLQSAEYNELISRYCFFGTRKSPQQATAAAKTTSPQTTSSPADRNLGSVLPQTIVTDGADDEPDDEPDNDAAPAKKSEGDARNGPSDLSADAPDLSSLTDGADDRRTPPPSPRPFRSGSTSPRPKIGSPNSRTRATSPVSFHFPYHQNLDPGIFHDANSPTPIIS